MPRSRSRSRNRKQEGEEASSRSRSRSLSKSRKSKNKSYYLNGDKMIDSKTKQLLFKEFNITVMGRTKLKSIESFDEMTAMSLLDKHMKRKKGKGMVNFLVDRLRFTKIVYHVELNYREVIHFYRYSIQPTVFTLCVQEEQSGKKFYETYMATSADDVSAMHSFIEQAHEDDNLLVHNSNKLPRISPVSTLISEKNGDETQYKSSPIPQRSSQHVSIYSTYDQNKTSEVNTPPVQIINADSKRASRESIEIVEVIPMSQSPKSKSEDVPDLVDNPSPASTDSKQSSCNLRTTTLDQHSMYVKRDYQTENPRNGVEEPSQNTNDFQNTNLKVEREMNSTEKCKTFPCPWKNNVTFLNINSINGPSISDGGPFYMYLTRHPKK